MSRLTYIGANAIEQVLLDVNAALDRIRAGAYYAGELFRCKRRLTVTYERNDYICRRTESPPTRGG